MNVWFGFRQPFFTLMETQGLEVVPGFVPLLRSLV